MQRSRIVVDTHRGGGRYPSTRDGDVFTCESCPMRDLPIRDESIRLGQALKLAGLADSGGEARALVESGEVTVNGEAETRRGRQLHAGDVVALGDDAVRIAPQR
jgi:ribosome-associated protein